MSQVFKTGSVIGQDKVRVHRGGNRIDGVTKDNELFFNDLPVPKRSKIDLSFDRKMSFEMGQLAPILCQECVPGDTFHIAQAHNLMFAPLLAPLYQRIDYRTYYFFVPTRLVDDGWKDFITMKNPNYILPYITGSAIRNTIGGGSVIPNNTIFDYFDLPVQEANFASSVRHLCAHPFRMYNLIWNEYFRDEFKQNEIPIVKTGGFASSEIQNFVVRNIGWEKDYFTTAQITPQVGADVPIPHDNFVVMADGTLKLANQYGDPLPLENTPGNDGATLIGALSEPGQQFGKVSYTDGLKIGSTTIATINDLRTANHLQELRDKLKIAGTRYNEAILAEYGVVVPDYRIQRPEYIGGFASPVEIGKVMQTTPTTGSGGTPLGSFAGQANGSGRMPYIHYSCSEHGYIIGVCCVVPRTAYYQGIPRQFIKDTYFDFYHPDLATLGDQELFDDELFVQLPQNSTHRFGYQQRYAEYKFAQDRINGEFRTNLNFWHMARQFAQTPALNANFVESNPTNSIFAVPSAPNHIYAEIYQEIASVRPMPISVQPNFTNVE